MLNVYDNMRVYACVATLNCCPPPPGGQFILPVVSADRVIFLEPPRFFFLRKSEIFPHTSLVYSWLGSIWGRIGGGFREQNHGFPSDDFWLI